MSGRDESWAMMTESYGELRRMAHAMMRGEALTLQPTALVHEVFVSVVERSVKFENDKHFLGRMSRELRTRLLNHIRDRRRLKRGGGVERVTLEEPVIVRPTEELDPFDLREIHEALEKIRAESPLDADVVELRMFCELKLEDIARLHGVSEKTVAMSWKISIGMLRKHLKAFRG